MGRKNFGPKSVICPEPVLIIAAYGEDGSVNAMNAAWGGIHDTNEIYMCLSCGHKTVKNLLSAGAFTVSMGEERYVAACDYLGIHSGNDMEDKFERSGLTAAKSAFVNAPVINELSVCLECTLKSYDSDSGSLVGNIVNVSVDDSMLTDDGKVDVSKLRPITYDSFNHTYRVVGETVAKAYSVGKTIG